MTPPIDDLERERQRERAQLQRHARLAADLLLHELGTAHGRFELIETHSMCELHRITALLRISGSRSHPSRDTADARLYVALRWPSAAEAYRQVISELITETCRVHDLQLHPGDPLPHTGEDGAHDGAERLSHETQQPLHPTPMQPCRLCVLSSAPLSPSHSTPHATFVQGAVS